MNGNKNEKICTVVKQYERSTGIPGAPSSKVGQVSVGGSYFVENPEEILAKAAVMKLLKTGADVTRADAEKVVESLRKTEDSPRVLFPIRGTEVYTGSNGEELKDYATIKKTAAGYDIREVHDWGQAEKVRSLVSVPIRESDLCFGTVGSYLRSAEDGGSKDFFTHELFDNAKEAEEFLSSSRATFEEFAKGEGQFQYKVEVFARSHITQTSWYKRSMEELRREEPDLER